MSANLIAISAAARLFGVSPFTVRRLIAAGEIRAVNVGARRLIPATEVERVILHGAGKPRMRRHRSKRSNRSAETTQRE